MTRADIEEMLTHLAETNRRLVEAAEHIRAVADRLQDIAGNASLPRREQILRRIARMKAKHAKEVN